PDPAARQKVELRMRLLEQMNGVIPARDTPRGLVATISDNSFNGTILRETAAVQIARLAAIVAAHPGLRVEVEGHTDSAATEAMASRRAAEVRGILTGRGLPSS